MSNAQTDNGIAAVFFDLGDTLGTATISGQPPRLSRFDLFPFVLQSPSSSGVLADLRKRGLRIGVISNTGDQTGVSINAVLQPTGLLAQLDLDLVLYSGDEGVTKSSSEIFNRAAIRAGLAASACLFVGEDVAERAVAAAAGWAVCPHPLLVGEVLEGQLLQYVRLTVPAAHATAPWRDELRRRAIVPQHMAGPRGRIVYGLTSQRVSHELANMQFGVEFLGEAGRPSTTDLYILRDDLAAASGFLSSKGEAAVTFAASGDERAILSASPEGVVAALPPDRGPDRFHFASARHGHTLKLTPDPLLWDIAPPVAPPAFGFTAATSVLSPAALEAFARISPDAILHAVERYTGQRPLDGSENGRRIVSRHISDDEHHGNRLSVAQLAADLEAAGQGRFQVSLIPFTLSGRTLHNVEAELAGASPELVLVTAHLDSTAGSDDVYDPAKDPAPGADDDASGVAAVLAIAAQMAILAQASPPARTLRFVLFNAEEQGLVGSRAYARRSKTRGETIAAVWQMDMIGYNATPRRDWEVHAGFQASPSVEARSRRLADLLVATTPVVVPELPAPGNHNSSFPSGDPADGRSDHASFQAHGYPACVTSEDFFIDAPDGAAPDANPNYHRSDDREIDPEYAAALARAVAGAAWVTASEGHSAAESAFAFTPDQEPAMSTAREFDSRTAPAAKSTAALAAAAAAPATASRTRVNALTGTPAVVAAAAPAGLGMPFVGRALAFVQKQAAGFAAAGGPAAEFVADSIVQRTSAGGAAVNLMQTHRGLTVFQMSRTVRFDPAGKVVDAAGDTAPLADDLSTEPLLSAELAVLKAAQHLATTGGGQTFRNGLGERETVASINIAGYTPKVISGFPLPARPTVLDKGPFENPIPAYLLIFNEPARPRLAWHIVFTFPRYADQYTAIVAADNSNGELLYCKSTMRHALARGRVFEFSPGVQDRRFIDFPRPLADYPAMPATPLNGFPAHWVDEVEAEGNSAKALLNFSTETLNGVLSNGVVEFDPAAADGDEQKLLNIFYFCNYMHDFLFILGFDEASGNFQQINFTNTGSGADAILAHAHSGAVEGTANMSTGPDGLPPTMNMGLVTRSDRHTAFDADVVFHEYVHGLTNRLVGGRLNPNALDKLQSGGMGEGWSDYFALTIQNYFAAQEKVVTGNWVVDNQTGIRRAPYDDNYPFKFGDLAQFPEVHDIGEVWCAALMMMTRRLRAALGDNQQGYRLSWTMVVDGLKLTPPNPTFLDARDAILKALDDLVAANRINAATHRLARRASWQSFAHFGMGVNAFSSDANDLDGIVADTTLPPEI